MEVAAVASAPSAEEVSELRKHTRLSEAQITRLHERFTALDRCGKGLISPSDFQSIASVASNPLLSRVLTVVSSSGDGNISFVDFAKAFAVFLPQTDRQEKLRFTYMMYDIDGDDKISNSDLMEALKMMVGPNLTDVQLQQIVDKTFIEVDSNRDGFITFSDFEKLSLPISLDNAHVLQF
ncbi:calcineurin B subunit, putative [Trypanosoma brucei gambiense DAL972]|uniref:Calcineurin B subunit, putative n=2 Tax=Trypanosoma brucei TaxID=5691 RepID=D0A107_TRYB9|nr:calcineurin B subunit, putative [Trypanosoma brucei gambiense DAL972]RHW68893.1 calcineurin B subunit [Trypanosoma brucei equiperdum]CBH14949.1 calcineurin B subunit, putative [Trypanosoma brucei gambiense DAL972]|eukprot:XP_011777215.1 calcineurin B subunit, putative [Trypanosoma brucei gambiense DAL972]